jgi:hypothetical protein
MLRSCLVWLSADTRTIYFTPREDSRHSYTHGSESSILTAGHSRNKEKIYFQIFFPLVNQYKSGCVGPSTGWIIFRDYTVGFLSESIFRNRRELSKDFIRSFIAHMSKDSTQLCKAGPTIEGPCHHRLGIGSGRHAVFVAALDLSGGRAQCGAGQRFCPHRKLTIQSYRFAFCSGVLR